MSGAQYVQGKELDKGYILMYTTNYYAQLRKKPEEIVENTTVFGSSYQTSAKMISRMQKASNQCESLQEGLQLAETPEFHSSMA